MSYDLAKELKEAGFPQIGKPYSVVADLRGDALTLDGKENVCIPTLSELIEACGKDLPFERNGLAYTFSLNYEGEKKKWCACFDGLYGAYDLKYGSTPEEAVARLWLALDKTPSTSS